MAKLSSQSPLPFAGGDFLLQCVGGSFQHFAYNPASPVREFIKRIVSLLGHLGAEMNIAPRPVAPGLALGPLLLGFTTFEVRRLGDLADFLRGLGRLGFLRYKARDIEVRS